MAWNDGLEPFSQQPQVQDVNAQCVGRFSRAMGLANAAYEYCGLLDRRLQQLEQRVRKDGRIIKSRRRIP